MSWRAVAYIVGTGLALLPVACEKPRRVPPIVHVKPVEVIPYEEGYKVGFPFGEAAGKPKVDLPPEAQVARMAGEEAAKDSDRDAKWERGFAEGYLDGFRKNSLGQK